MHLIAQNRYKFNMPVSLQKSHLLDIWHLDKAHWFTLCGVSVGEVFTKSPALVKFNLHRFGSIKQINIRQTEDTTEVDLDDSLLRFVIEDEGAIIIICMYHYSLDIRHLDSCGLLFKLCFY
jgi:hypothetical protein